MNTPLPSHEIETRLKSVRSLIHRTQRTRAIFLIITVAIGGLLAVMAVDWIFAPLPSFMRWILSAVWIALLVVFSLRAIAPLLREIPLIRIARWLEERHPEMQERLSTVLEPGGAKDGVSKELLEEIAKAAGRDIGTLDAQDEVRAARKRRSWKAPALITAGLMVLVLVVWPQSSFRLLLRAVAPFSDAGNAGAAAFQIQPGNIELLEGDALRILFTAPKKKDAPKLRLVTQSTGETIQPVTAQQESFSFTLDPVKETIRYQVLAGRSQSDIYTATVLPIPVFAKPEIKLEYPSYTALPEAVLDPSKGIQAVSGTKATLTASINTGLESAWIEMNGKRLAEADIQPSANGGNIAFNWLLTPEGSGEALVVLSHKLRERIESLRFQVQVTGDRAPEVAILSPTEKRLRVRPEETLTILHEIIEDYGLSEVAIEVEADGDKSSIVQVLPARVGAVNPPRYRGEAPLLISALRERQPKLRSFRFRITARDTRSADLGGPGIGHSEWIEVSIDENTESLASQELRSQQEQALKSLDQAISEVRDAKKEVNRSEDEMREQSPSPEAAKRLEEAAKKLANAEEITRDLAADLQQSLHAAKAEKTEATSQDLAAVREKVENTPLQENAKQRGEQLRQADQQMEQAIAQMEEIRNEIKRDQQRAEQVVALQELAARQNELARQAESKAKAEATTQKQWNEQQNQVAQKLQQAASMQPDAKAQAKTEPNANADAKAKAEALKAQAEEARALADKANELAKAQEQLGKESERLASNKSNAKPPTPEALAEKQQSQAEAAAELAEQIKSLPSSESNPKTEEATKEATEAAEKAAKAAAQASDKMAEVTEPATGSPKPAPSGTPPGESTPPPSAAEMAAAKTAAPLNERAGKQMEKSAEALEDAAKQLEKAAQAAAAMADPESLAAQAERAQAQAEKAQAQAEKARALADKANELAKAQEQLGKESEQLASNDSAPKPPSPQALAEKQQSQAQAAADLAEQIKSLPPRESNPKTDKATAKATEEAKKESQKAAKAAEKATKAAKQAADKMAKAAKPSAGKQPKPGKPAAGSPKPSASGTPPPPPSETEMAAAKTAAPLNEEAGEQMKESADALEDAAKEFEKAAKAATAQAAAAKAAAAKAASAQAAAAKPAAGQPAAGKPSQGQAQATTPPMAASLKAAAQAASQAAATSDAAQAAKQSAAAAKALSQAAAAAQAAMKGSKPGAPKPGMAGKPGSAPKPGMAQKPGSAPKPGSGQKPGTGEEPGSAQPGADPGLPPELGKLGISATDWEQIKGSLGSDVGGAEAEGIPAEYQSLVRDYFQNLSKTPADKR